MKGIKDLFRRDQLELLTSAGVELSSDQDYSDDELIAMHERITNRYLLDGFADGEPTHMARPWEDIIDIFSDQLDI